MMVGVYGCRDVDAGLRVGAGICVAKYVMAHYSGPRQDLELG